MSECLESFIDDVASPLPSSLLFNSRKQKHRRSMFQLRFNWNTNFFSAVSQLSRPRQMALAGIQQQLEEAVQRQVAATEEKVRAFTAEQYQILEQFRENAHAEHTHLIRYHDESIKFAKSSRNFYIGWKLWNAWKICLGLADPVCQETGKLIILRLQVDLQPWRHWQKYYQPGKQNGHDSR